MRRTTKKAAMKKTRKKRGRSAKPVMIQGTASHVGKTVITAALCRILRKRGLSVAPFKAQNMALNSFVTDTGAEIGRAQALQAEAAGIAPTADMNPVLLKPTGDSRTQVIIHGRVYGNMSAAEYHRFKAEAASFVRVSYERLAALHDVVVIEGAGSPAEINLRKNDIANMGTAFMAKSPVLLVGDIDRGGVLASIVGTMELLTRKERASVKGFIINRFRGDIDLLTPGIEFLKKRTGLPSLGVIPYMSDITLPDEDSVALDTDRSARSGANGAGKINLKVIRLPRISNFTDFDPLGREPDLSLSFITDPGELEGADMAIIPGSKNTLEDLEWLKSKGFTAPLKRLRSKGAVVAGICGGYQMLGTGIKDPTGAEPSASPLSRKRKGASTVPGATGLGLLRAETVLKGVKDTFQVKAELFDWMKGTPNKTMKVTGYEIHMGETRSGAQPFSKIFERNSAKVDISDGAVSADGLVWGTYIHGIFDNDAFRASVIDGLKRRKGLRPSDGSSRVSFNELKEASIETLAATVEEALDMERIFNIIGI
jgi:adenosylcobyric acid synthase